MWLLSWRYSGSRVRAAVSSQASVAARMLLLRDGSRSTALLTALTLALRPCQAAQHPQPCPFGLSAAALEAFKLVHRPLHHHHSCTGASTLPRHTQPGAGGLHGRKEHCGRALSQRGMLSAHHSLR